VSGGASPAGAAQRDDRQRIAMWVQYDGSGFNGWQLQKGSSARSVQGALEEALGFVANHPVRLHCAGRTDAGVHATAQLVHFDAANHRSLQSWVRGANANLDCPVSVLQAFEVTPDFHARHSATARHYRYLIYNDVVRPALGADYVTWVRHPLDADSMHAHAQVLLGEQDFSSFRASSCQSSTPMRRVDRVSVRRSGPLIVFEISANAFLHHMVRNIAGALIAVGRGGLEAAWLSQLLQARDRTRAPDTAPANGLYLVGVDYPAEHGLKAPEKGPWFAPKPA